jgi:lipid-binding SYLF domain-containing protein
MRFYLMLLGLILSVGLISSCAKPQGYSPQSKRAYIQQMKTNTLADLYAAKPVTRDLIEHAAGYGVFSNISTQLLVVGSGNGYGIVVDKATGKETYMKMAEGGIGLGVGVVDMREVIIFNSPIVLNEFIRKGWDFGVQGDAVLKSKSEGAAASGQIPFNSDMIIYQLTDQGVALRTNVGAEKYWIDSELNYY